MTQLWGTLLQGVDDPAPGDTPLAVHSGGQAAGDPAPGPAHPMPSTSMGFGRSLSPSTASDIGNATGHRGADGHRAIYAYSRQRVEQGLSGAALQSPAPWGNRHHCRWGQGVASEGRAPSGSREQVQRVTNLKLTDLKVTYLVLSGSTSLCSGGWGSGEAQSRCLGRAGGHRCWSQVWKPLPRQLRGQGLQLLGRPPAPSKPALFAEPE